MWLKRKRVMVLTTVFIVMWFVIILCTPSPLGGKRGKDRGSQTVPDHPKPPQTGRRHSTNLPRIRIVDVDAGQSEDREEKRRELELMRAPDNLAESKDAGGRSRDEDAGTSDEKDSVDIEDDLVPRELPEGMGGPAAVWNLAGSWVDSRQITPQENPDLGMVLRAMATGPIVRAEVGYKGTQLKARLVLTGGQWVMFKPGRYKRDEVIEGTPYAGYDRHNGEIAAFHLDRILGFHRAPIVVGRRINLHTDIKPVASKTLLDTFMKQDNRTCFYGKCYYCHSGDPACADENGDMEGSLTLWLPKERKLKKWHHNWSRTYRDNKKAKWEYDDNYCQTVLKEFPLAEHRRIVDMLDTAAFDYLIGNADRHQYETFEADGNQGMLLLMDSGKSFGNPHHDEKSILAPLYQCCKIRKSTWSKLLSLQDGRLSDAMRRVLSHDPLAPILTELHLKAMDRRLVAIIATIKECLKTHGEDYVLIT